MGETDNRKTGKWERQKNRKREMGDGKTETGDGRRETGDGRRETGDGRRETGDGRRETGDGRRETGDGRRETGDGRRETGDGRRETGDGRRENWGTIPQCKTQESENWKTAKPDNGRDRNAGRNKWGKFGNSIDSKTRKITKSQINYFNIPIKPAQIFKFYFKIYSDYWDAAKAREPQKSVKHSFWLPVPKAQWVWTSEGKEEKVKIWSCEGVVRRRRAGKLRRGSLSEIGGLAKGLTESQACVYREEMRAWVQ
ncbi:hypothetical protein EDD22DRAFT_961216 [Suillus occidentalis]|nr:hypothetical protein EDD22DRAFT_961216 [Suillus occidentalis]